MTSITRHSPASRRKCPRNALRAPWRGGQPRGRHETYPRAAGRREAARDGVS